jgi:aminoglycoside 3-N-acetyltransferase
VWNKERILQDIQDIGVRGGDALVVHASMRAIGKVTGGADAVIDALLEAVGPAGAILAPAFNGENYVPETWPEQLQDPRFRAEMENNDYNPEGINVGEVGILAERLWRREDALHSFHPTLSFAAVGGPNAAFLTERAPFHYPLGANSPLARLHQLNGGVLLLGVGHNANSSLHLAEVWADAPYARRGRRIRTGAVESEIMQGSPECSAGFWKIEPVLRQARILKTGYVGNAPSQYMRLQHVASMAIEMLKGSPDALLCDDPGCNWCMLARKFTCEQDR